MSQTETTRAEELEQQMISSLSHEAVFAMLKISMTWPDIVGSSGSWVSKDQLRKMLRQERPWSANKLTNNGCGRNGIIWSLIPMLKKNNLVIVHPGFHFTRYELTEVGTEVIRAMVWNCSNCNNTRECDFCNSGVSEYQCSHYSLTFEEMKELTQEQMTERCATCNDEGKQICTRCRGTLICHSCIQEND